MSDLTEQLSSILSDPAGMERIKAMAQSLLSSNSGQSDQQQEPQAVPSTQTPPQIDLSGIANMAKMLGSRKDDSRVNLLLALRPHLSQEKQLRVDKAVKMLRLLDLAPLLSQAGIFEL